jgi:sarcosine oxidase subunit gamma
LGTPFGRATRSTALPALVIGSGPGEWLVLGPPDAAAELRAALIAMVAGVDEFASVVDLTHGRALVRLRGAACSALLAKVCAVDLADAVIPDGAAFRSSVARVVTDVVRDDLPDGTRSYLLHCERATHAERLTSAAGETGPRPRRSGGRCWQRHRHRPRPHGPQPTPLILAKTTMLWS